MVLDEPVSTDTNNKNSLEMDSTPRENTNEAFIQTHGQEEASGKHTTSVKVPRKRLRADLDLMDDEDSYEESSFSRNHERLKEERSGHLKSSAFNILHLPHLISGYVFD
jgi:hypothetical protein